MNKNLEQQVDVISGFTADQWEKRLADTMKFLHNKLNLFPWHRTWVQHHNKHCYNSQCRRYTKARQVNWLGWKIHIARAPSVHCFALVIADAWLKMRFSRSKCPKSLAAGASLQTPLGSLQRSSKLPCWIQIGGKGGGKDTEKTGKEKEGKWKERQEKKKGEGKERGIIPNPVSYTHLTLPTNREV